MKKIMWLIMSVLAISCTPIEDDYISNNIKTIDVNTKPYEYSNDEFEVMELINEYRVNNGLNELKSLDFVSHLCNGHDNNMIQTSTVSHAGFQYRANIIFNTIESSNVAENIAYNFDNPNSAVLAWIKSEGHKANLLGDYDYYGIGVVVDSITNKKYYTNIFVKKKE